MFVGKIPITVDCSVLSNNNIVDFVFVATERDKSVFQSFVVSYIVSSVGFKNRSITYFTLCVSYISQTLCEFGQVVRIGIVEFFFRHCVEILTERVQYYSSKPND